jgi:hypothetical protein
VVGYNIVCNFLEPSGVAHNFRSVNILDLDIHQRIPLLLVPADVLNAKTQHILIADGIGDHVLVQALAEQVFGGSFSEFILGCIFRKDGRASETEELCLFESSS